MHWLPIETTVAPTAEPVPLDMLRDWCRVGGTDDDAKLYGLGLAACRHIEDRPGGLRIMTQTVTLRAPCFRDEMLLPVHPVQSVSMAYLDDAGALQTLSPAIYETALYGVAPRVMLAAGMSWPSTADSPQAVEITAVVGWDGINALPEPVRLAIQMLVCHWYDNPAAGAAPAAVDALLSPYRQPVGF